MPVGKKARVGVLSAGSWCSVSHIPELLKRDDVQLVVVTREEPDIARWTKERFGFQHAGSDWRKALDEHELDVVVVGSPAAIHYEQVKAALESGAHVLAEKPFTLRSADAWDLVRTAERLSRHIVVALGWNYSPMVLDARELLRSRGVGEIEHVTVNFTSSERPLFFGSEEFSYPGMHLEIFPNPATYTDPKLSGGGFGYTMLCHALALFFFLVENIEPAGCFAKMGNFGAPVDLHDALVVEFTNGANGVIAGSSTPRHHKHTLDIKVVGSEGMFLLDLHREFVWLFHNDTDQVVPRIEPGAGDYVCSGPPNAIVDLALGKPTQNHSPAYQSAHVVELIDAAHRSRRSGQFEKVIH